MDVMFDDETAWLTLGQMSQLFGRDMSVIGKQLSEDPDPFLSKDRKMIGFNVD